jgi:hypothetical protein
MNGFGDKDSVLKSKVPGCSRPDIISSSSDVEAIVAHRLGPGIDKVIDELVVALLSSIDLCHCPELRV